jgi:hypothetical protein
VLFPRAAHAAGPVALLRRRPHVARSLAWAAYAASGWAAAYAIGVRGYQGLGGMEGLPGTFEDPAGMQRASLVAGGVILLVAVGALGLVRPWGVQLPRLLVIVPALAGSAFAMAHALTAYITKTLQVLGLVDLQFRGWAQLDVGALIRWDRLFYEPCSSDSGSSSPSARCTTTAAPAALPAERGGSCSPRLPARSRSRRSRARWSSRDP